MSRIGHYSVIPNEYRKYWELWNTYKILFHVTSRENWDHIKKVGYIEPRDPFPQYWAGMKAVFLSDPDDPLYPESLQKLLSHIKESHENLVRLHIKTHNKLYKSNASKRTFHIMTLDPIDLKDVVKWEVV